MKSFLMGLIVVVTLVACGKPDESSLPKIAQGPTAKQVETAKVEAPLAVTAPTVASPVALPTGTKPTDTMLKIEDEKVVAEKDDASGKGNVDELATSPTF